MGLNETALDLVWTSLLGWRVNGSLVWCRQRVMSDKVDGHVFQCKNIRTEKVAIVEQISVDRSNSYSRLTSRNMPGSTLHPYLMSTLIFDDSPSLSQYRLPS